MIKAFSIYLLFAVLLSGLTGCSLFRKPVEVQTIANEKVALRLSEPKPVEPRVVEWYVITPENHEQVFDSLKGSNTNLVLFGLTDDGYENLSFNLLELRNFIYQQRVIIQEYKQYYEKRDESQQKAK